MGARSNLLQQLSRISLSTHIQDVATTLCYEDPSGAILVGHILVVLTGVAGIMPNRLVHLDAYRPFSERD